MSGTNYNPYNLPLTGTYLADQRFSITNLENGLYSLGVHDPITRVTYGLSLSARYQEYKSPKLQINYINSETADWSGSVSLTFESNEPLSNKGVTITLDKGLTTTTLSAARGTPIIFTDLDSSIIDNNDLIVIDQAGNRTWNLKIHIGYDTDISFIQYNDNVLYQTNDTIIFPASQTARTQLSKVYYQNATYSKEDSIVLN